MVQGTVGGDGTRTMTLPHFAVDRPRLLDRLDKVPPGGLGLVVAAAGTGKSVLIGQWLSDRGGSSVAVHPVTEADADGAVFARNLVMAMPFGLPTRERLVGLAAAGGSSLGDGFVDAVLDALADLDHPHVLVVDDLHRLANTAVLADLRRMVAELPVSVRLVVGSRWDPALDLGRLRLDGRLVEVRAADLAFDVSEARNLVEAVSGKEVSRDDGESLVDRTDGWAVGLHLAAVSLQGVEDVGAAIRDFAGDERLVAEYLTTEVLDRQTPAVRDFLLRTSVLDRLEPELCAAVAGERAGTVSLDDLADRALPMTRIDRHAYRYHHLFAELLRFRFRAASPASWRDAHAAAAAWLSARNRHPEAIEHLLACGDGAGAFETIRRVGQAYFERNQAATLLGWLERLADLYDDPPALHEVHVLAACTASDRSVRGREAHRRITRPGSGAGPGEVAAADAVYASLVQIDLAPAEARRAARAALRGLDGIAPEDVPDFFGIGGRDSVDIIARFALAMADLLDGRTDAAESAIENLDDHPGADYPVWRVHLSSALALCWALRGACTDAEGLARATVDAARDAGFPHHVATALSYLALAKVASLREERDVASRATRDASICLGRTRRAALAGLVRLLRAENLAVTEGPAATLHLLDEEPAPGRPGALSAGWEADLRCRMHVQRRELVTAEAVLARSGGWPRLDRSHVDLALARGDVGLAADGLARWEPSPRDVVDQVRRSLRVALVHESRGEGGATASALAHAVALAQVERLRRPFTECPSALRLLRSTPLPQARAFVATVLAIPPSAEARSAAGELLVEPLTDRERTVLEYLPTRMSNSEIATELYVSVNTMKTHLRNVYRKLDVTDRDAAVARAAEIGLI